MKELTNRQKEVLTFIKKYIVSHGYPPTVREICKGLGVSSPATIQSHLVGIENKGYIRKVGKLNRAIELNVQNEYEEKSEDVIEVPLLGKVTAGNPIEAIENPGEYFSLPASIVRGKEVFTLTVSGDSMINAGILDGDILVVEKKKTAYNGQIIVAMNEDNEVTVKRFYKEKDHIRLQPENDNYEPIILNNIAILGLVIGLYRSI